MRLVIATIALTVIGLRGSAEATDEAPLLPDAEHFQSTHPLIAAPAVGPLPGSPDNRPASPDKHPLEHKSSLFSGTARRNAIDVKSPFEDSLFARKSLPRPLRRSLRFHASPNVELFPTLSAAPLLPAIALPSATTPVPMSQQPDQPVTLQGDFREFPPLD